MKRTVTDCDKCEESDVVTVEIRFYCGSSLNGVETEADYKNKDLCIGCLKELFYDALIKSKNKFDDKFSKALLDTL